MNAVVLPAALAPYRSAFESAAATASDTAALRSAAFDHFLAAGFPSTRDEAWKYTSLRRLESRRFSDPPANDAAVSRARRAWHAHPGGGRPHA